MNQGVPDILEKILVSKRVRVADRKRAAAPRDVERRAREMPAPKADFLKALRRVRAGSSHGLHVIAEVKKASPSRGVLRADFQPLAIAKEYAAAGATALSILTEEDHFQGSDEYLRNISKAVGIPTLRKDFLFDPYQVFEAKVLGASAFLLIVACLPPKDLAALISLGKSIGLTPLVEVHGKEEVAIALDAGAPLIGINNRDLRTFETSLDVTYALRPLIPAGIPVISESGIFTHADMTALAAGGVQATLIGESLMREDDIGGKLRELLA